MVVRIDAGPDDFPGLLQSPRGLDPHAFGLEGLVEAFDLPVGLGMATRIREWTTAWSRKEERNSVERYWGPLSEMMRGLQGPWEGFPTPSG